MFLGNYVSTCRNIDTVSYVLPLNGVKEPNNDELAVEIEALSETIDENLRIVNHQVLLYLVELSKGLIFFI